MDHSSYSYEIPDETFTDEVAENNPNEIDNLQIEEKVGDDYLIDLYRERRFLYDKRDKNFKDNQMKDNAWLEISKIMIEKNCGDYYTPEYCQKKMRSLREKFSRLQRNEQNSKSGSAASTEKRSPLLNQLSFLNTYIQRRRTCSNVKDVKEELDNLKKNTDNAIVDNDHALPKKHEISQNKTTDEAKENKFIKRKKDEENILGVITNLTNSILSESSSNSSSQNSSNLRTADNVFAEYIALELGRMSEPERMIKKQKLIEVLSTPMEKILIICKQCCQHEIFIQSIKTFHGLFNHNC